MASALALHCSTSRAKKIHMVAADQFIEFMFTYDMNETWNEFPVTNSLNWSAPNIRIFIAQLAEHCNANAEAMGSNPVETLDFFRTKFCNCLNCKNSCYDRSSISEVTNSIEKQNPEFLSRTWSPHEPGSSEHFFFADCSITSYLVPLLAWLLILSIYSSSLIFAKGWTLKSIGQSKFIVKSIDAWSVVNPRVILNKYAKSLSFHEKKIWMIYLLASTV